MMSVRLLLTAVLPLDDTTTKDGRGIRTHVRSLNEVILTYATNLVRVVGLEPTVFLFPKQVAYQLAPHSDCKNILCPRRDSNSHTESFHRLLVLSQAPLPIWPLGQNYLVGEVGFEPTRLSTRGSRPRKATSYITRPFKLR